MDCSRSYQVYWYSSRPAVAPEQVVRYPRWQMGSNLARKTHQKGGAVMARVGTQSLLQGRMPAQGGQEA